MMSPPCGVGLPGFAGGVIFALLDGSEELSDAGGKGEHAACPRDVETPVRTRAGLKGDIIAGGRGPLDSARDPEAGSECGSELAAG